MNGIKVSQLPEAVDVNNSDIAMIVQEGSSKKVNVENLLASKQDKLTAGTGIDITNNVISNTQTSAEWGNITGTLSNQTDLNTALSGKQDTLVSGTNIKTINNNSILGSGNLTIQGGSEIYIGDEQDAPAGTKLLIDDDTVDIAPTIAQEIYSTDEIKIGTWIDGKPLYRNVIQINVSTSQASLSQNVTSLNIDTNINIYGTVKDSTHTTSKDNVPINFNDGTNKILVWFRKNTNTIEIRNTLAIGTLNLVIEYTKTTDTVGGGN